MDTTSFVTNSANTDINANQTQSTMQIHVDNNSVSNFKGDDEAEEDSDDVED